MSFLKDKAVLSELNILSIKEELTMLKEFRIMKPCSVTDLVN